MLHSSLETEIRCRRKPSDIAYATIGSYVRNAVEISEERPVMKSSERLAIPDGALAGARFGEERSAICIRLVGANPPKTQQTYRILARRNPCRQRRLRVSGGVRRTHKLEVIGCEERGDSIPVSPQVAIAAGGPPLAGVCPRRYQSRLPYAPQ